MSTNIVLRILSVISISIVIYWSLLQFVDFNLRESSFYNVITAILSLVLMLAVPYACVLVTRKYGTIGNDSNK